jgi:hypothetical protein
MDKIKQNPFLAGIGGALLLFLLLAGVLIYPIWSEKGTIELSIKRDRRNLETASRSTPSQADIRSWKDEAFNKDAPEEETDYWGKLVASYLELAKFFSEYDLLLEWWMTNASAPPGNAALPAYDEMAVARDRKTAKKGEFTTKLQDAATELGKKLAQATPPVKLGMPGEEEGTVVDPNAITFGFNWETIPWDDISKEDWGPILRNLQKRLRIRERIVSLCTGSDVNVGRMVDVYFFNKISPLLRGMQTWEQRPQAGTEEELPYPAVPERSTPDKFKEFRLPGDLGETITFGVTVDLPYSEAGKFIQAMLNRDIAPNLLVNIVGARVTLAPHFDAETGSVSYQHEYEEEFKYEEAADAKETERNRLEAIRKFYGKQKPMAVRLMLTCQVIDFDPSKLPAWARDHLPAWAR